MDVTVFTRHFLLVEYLNTEGISYEEGKKNHAYSYNGAYVGDIFCFRYGTWI
jgi:hypothetical protein